MSDYTAVNAAAMAEGIADLDKAHKDLVASLSNLEGDLKTNLAAWEGEARQTYYAAQEAWNEDCRKMQEVIAKMNVVLGQITDDYASTENKIVGNFGG